MENISYSKNTLRRLRKMPRNEALRIQSKIRQYADDPASQASNVKALKGSSYIRLRIGDWRVIMDDQGNVLQVLKIDVRGSIYD